MNNIEGLFLLLLLNMYQVVDQMRYKMNGNKSNTNLLRQGK